MELRHDPRIEQQLRMRKIAIFSSAVVLLASAAFFIYSTISSRTDSFAGTPSGSNTVAGKVFCDANQNGKQQGKEAGLENMTVNVYHDLNGNGNIDAGDSLYTSSVTNHSGNYSINLTYYTGTGHPNSYVVDVNAFTGSYSTTGGSQSVSFTSSGGSQTADFGLANVCGNDGVNYITGLLFNDADQDGVLDSAELGIEQVKIVLHQDADGDGTISSGDAVVDSAITDANGEYQFFTSYLTVEDSLDKALKGKNNDAFEKTGTIKTRDKEIDLQEGTAGLRFTKVNIPQGATITAATISVKSSDNSNSSNSSVTIYGHDHKNSPGFKTKTNNILGRTKTTASVSWTMPQFSQGQRYLSPDITAIVQEIVARSDWVSGKNMSVLIEKGSGSARKIFTVDDNKNNSAILEVEYTYGGTSNNQFIVEVDTTSNPDLQSMTTTNTYTVEFSNSGQQHTSGSAGGFNPSTLPVDLIYFKANKPDQTGIELKWATAMEENNSHFDIERRADNGEFIRIDRIQGHGNSDVVLRYKYTDYNYPTSANVIYYRLKQVDYDGKYEYSPIVYVGGEEHVQTRVFPNPADEQVTISVPGESFDVQLISSVGVPVKEIRDAYDQVSIPTTSLHNGYYVARIVVNGQERSEKVLIRHTTN